MKACNLLFIIAVSVLLVVSGCSSKQGSKSKSDKKDVGPLSFPYPSVPAMVTSGAEADIYAVTRFWDRYFDSISEFRSLPETELNNAMKSYISGLWDIPFAEALKAQEHFTERLFGYHTAYPDDSIYSFFCTLMENALYNPQSDFRNEDLYVPVLEMMCRDPYADSSENSTFRFRLEKCNLNRTGTVAGNFPFTDSKGQRSNLHDIKADYIMILFSNPGCAACAETISGIMSSPTLSGMISEEKIEVLNIYIDEDLSAWKEALPDYPSEWINAFNDDFSLRAGNNYDIRAIPSLYLLDRSHKVLFKDISTPMLIHMAERLK